jgi:hypothetical protein
MLTFINPLTALLLMSSCSEGHNLRHPSRHLGWFSSISDLIGNSQVDDTSTNPYSAPAKSQCNNTADLTIWQDPESGDVKFAEHLREYSMACFMSFSGPSCVAESMKKNVGYTSRCASCMGALAQCTKDNCLIVCLGLDEDGCNTCVTDSCNKDFSDCSGLPEEEEQDQDTGRRKLFFGSSKTETSASCTPRPGLCSGTCTIAEEAPAKGSDLHITVNGACPNTTVSAATYNIRIVQQSFFGDIPVLEKKHQDASKDNKFSLPLGLGSVELPAVAFPVAAGQSLDISSVANIASYAPSGTVVSTVTAFDQNGGELFSFEIKIKV